MIDSKSCVKFENTQFTKATVATIIAKQGIWKPFSSFLGSLKTFNVFEIFWHLLTLKEFGKMNDLTRIGKGNKKLLSKLLRVFVLSRTCVQIGRYYEVMLIDIYQRLGKYYINQMLKIRDCEYEQTEQNNFYKLTNIANLDNVARSRLVRRYHSQSQLIYLSE